MLRELRFIRKSGAGAFGEVHEAQYRHVAVKIAPRDREPQAAPALRKEALALLACEQARVPHVIQFIDYQTSQICGVDQQGRLQGIKLPEFLSPGDRKCDALVMPMLYGGSLQDKLDKGPLSETQSKQIAKTLLEALVGLHENAHIVHRDLKPGNIMFENGEVILIDFGISSTSDRPSTPIGTPYYMAPEVWNARKNRPYSSKADLWSLGVLIYQSLTGELPFQANNTMQLFIKLDAHLRYPERLKFPLSLSDSSKEFILALLSPAADRPTAQEALKHPWLQKSIPVRNLPAIRKWRL